MNRNLRLFLSDPWNVLFLVGSFFASLAVVLILTGCVVRRVTVDQRIATLGTNGVTTLTTNRLDITSRRPGWPWTVEALDVSKLGITVRTNGLVFGAAGEVTQSSNTNFNDMLGIVVGAAVKAAVGK